MSDAITVGKHPCIECGGEMQWSARQQALVCPYCGAVSAWKPAEGVGADGIAEHDLQQALANADQHRGWGEAKREVRCQSCQAISVFDGNKVAQRCDFCGSPSIIAQAASQDAITPESLLPFKLSYGQVRDAVRTWYGSRWFAPNRLKRAALTDTLHGVYLPYWTFDAHVDAPWNAEAGHYYYVTVTDRDSQGNTRSRQERRVRWVPASGRVKHFFDDVLVAASSGVHAPLLRQIEPFPTTSNLKAYTPEFVRGWTVERYQVDLPAAARVAGDEMQASTRQLCAAQVPGDTHRNLQVHASYQDQTFKHVLVPVWLVGYTYGSRSFQIVVNGYTGAIAGERPYSVWKVLSAVLAALLALMLMAYLSSNL
jgi:predicted RNA-binding Zn-ribbon protein involved in translation (DUF1610 family)